VRGQRRLDARALAALAVAILLGVAMSAALRQHQPRQVLTRTPVVAASLEDPGSPRFGPPSARVTIVVFTDYQCAVCRRTDGALHRLMARDPDVAVIFKDWPILGDGSRTAARAALAAHRQGRYREVHRAFMESRTRLDAERIRDLATAAGADWPRLLEDQTQHAEAIELQLRRHATQAWSLGIAGTPAYLVGPHLISGGLDDRALARAVADARRAGPPL